jgi:hypothetical protein
MYRIVDRVDARGGFALLLLLGTSLLALAQDSPGKRGGPDETDDAARRAAWFLRGRTVHGKPAADLLRRAYQQKLQLRQKTLERLQKAAAQANQASNQTSAGAGTTSATSPSGSVTPMTVPSGSAWVSLGPAPITAMGRFGDASGRITAVAIDQNDSTGNTVYVGGAYGGVWKSTNAAASDPTTVTWAPLYDTDPAAATLAVGAVTLQPTNSSVILVGTGEPNSALDSYYGMGILRSTNGGASWTLIPSATGGQSFKGMGVSKFAWKPDGSLVVAGFSNFTNAGAVNAGGGFQGIYYSTDGGATWTRATNATAGDTVFGSVSDVVYNASLGKFFAALKGQGIYSSTNGSTWTRLANQPVAFAPNCSDSLPSGSPDCDILRAALTVRPGSADLYAWVVGTDGTTNRGISKTNDGGATAWTALTVTGINSCGPSETGCGTSQGFYNLVLSAVPNSTNTDLYAGAVNLFKCSITGANPTCAVANSWLNLTHVYGTCNAANVSIHPDQHAIDFLQSNTNLIYFGNDGGAYRTLTGNTGMVTGTCNTATHNDFQDLNTSSLGSLTQFISISHHPTDDSVLLGGTQDNGSPAIASGQSSPPLNPPLWFEANGGDGGYNEIDQTNSNNWYTTNTDVSIQKCTTGTNCIETDVFSSLVTSATLSNDHGDFYTPYILDPANQTKLLVGTCRVWRVNNDGTGATKLSNKLNTGATTACVDSGSATPESLYVSALASGGPTTGNGSQVIYAGTSNGKIFVTTSADTGAASWVDRTGSINPNGHVVSKIAMDTTDATGQTAYLTLMGFTGGSGHVFKTTNAGVGWTDISAGLPDAPADSVAVDPIDHTIVYVGTDVGVFATNDNGANWSEFGTGLPNVATVTLRTFNSGGTRKLRVGTHGRGVWETDLASAPAVPTAVSVTPSSGSGITQTFSFLFSDAGGVSRLTYVQALINGSLSWNHACAVLYYQGTNRLYLVNDVGNGWQGPLTPGQAGTLQNSQCTLDAGASSVSAVGNNLTVNAALTFKAAFKGSKTVFLDAEDIPNSLSSGFQTLGTWSVPTLGPVAVSVTPSSGSGTTQTFALLYSDADGVGKLTYVQALINASLSWQNSCAILYYQSTNRLYLVLDSGAGWQGPLTPGQAGTLQNSQCTLNAGASSVSAVGNNLTVNAALTFKPAFGGNKTVYMDAEDIPDSLSSGFQTRGTWTVPSAPTAVSVTPSSGSGITQTFSFLFSDAGGASKITYIQALINGSLSWPNSCAVLYIQSSNRLYLVQDSGTGWQGPLTPGQAGTLSNSQCTLNAGASSVSAVGNNLTVNAALTFKPAFGGNKTVYMDAEDIPDSLSSGFQTRGTWTVPSAPTAVSVTPSSGSGTTQTFSFLFSDAGGASKITYIQALINGSLSWPNSCAVLYIQSTNRLYLVLDSGAGWQGPLTPGQAGTLSNSQCTLDGGGSSASAVGNNLTVNAALTFKAAFTGSKTVFLDAEDAPNSLSSGFQALGTWTVP